MRDGRWLLEIGEAIPDLDPPPISEAAGCSHLRAKTSRKETREFINRTTHGRSRKNRRS